MKLFFLFVTILSLNIFSGSTHFSNDLDEFTDTRQISLLLISDEGKFRKEWIGISCDISKPMLIVKKGSISTKESDLLVTLRFDKNKPIEKYFFYNSLDGGGLGTQDFEFIKQFLDELRNSNNLILKIEGEYGIMRFTDLNESSKHVSEFLTAASELPQSRCNLN